MLMVSKKDNGVLFTIDHEVLIETSESVKPQKPLHYHDHYALQLVIDGEGVTVFNGPKFPISKGSFFLCRPCDHYSLSGDNLKTRHIRTMESFLPKWVLNETAALNNPIVVILDNADFKSVNELIVLAERELKRDDFYRFEVIKDICAIVYTIFFRNAFAQEDQRDQLIQRVCYFIEHNNRFKDKITLEEISKYVGYSKYYTSAMFRKSCDRTLQEYIIGVRIDYAKTLLTKTDFSITKIIEECGFSSSSSFYTQFKKCVGISPLQYRKNARD